jgi:DNA (cytosine-5)-methyltransferase 1
MGNPMISRSSSSFRFADLFAGIGGFHAMLGALGGECVYASEIDDDAARIYERNWGTPVAGDIVEATTDRMDVPDHDVLAAGFPCQPFSKSGRQRGMDEARGTLFWNICRVLEERAPSLVILENVRNLAGPRHAHEWRVIVESLRELGYRVSSKPTIFSPHLLPPWLGGRPQVRDRVFILATRVNNLAAAQEDVAPATALAPVDGWDPQSWRISSFLDDDPPRDASPLWMSAKEVRWVEAWDDFVQTLRRAGLQKLPGFPIWADHFVHERDLFIAPGTPAWKANFLRKNSALYTDYQREIDEWRLRWGDLAQFPRSRRKLEWQAQDTRTLWEAVLHLRPSGIRAKRPTYLPALVAITQTSIVASRQRRVTVREAARLQGLPEWFDFGSQRDATSFKQLGNGVNVGAAYHVFRAHVKRDGNMLGANHPVVHAVDRAPESADLAMEPRHSLPARCVAISTEESIAG